MICHAKRSMTLSSMSSATLMIVVLAWNPRWVVMALTISLAISTLDCSRELGEILPRPWVPGDAVTGTPLFRVSVKRPPPSLLQPAIAPNQIAIAERPAALGAEEVIGRRAVEGGSVRAQQAIELDQPEGC